MEILSYEHKWWTEKPITHIQRQMSTSLEKKRRIAMKDQDSGFLPVSTQRKHANKNNTFINGEVRQALPGIPFMCIPPTVPHKMNNLRS